MNGQADVISKVFQKRISLSMLSRIGLEHLLVVFFFAELLVSKELIDERAKRRKVEFWVSELEMQLETSKCHLQGQMSLLCARCYIEPSARTGSSICFCRISNTLGALITHHLTIKPQASGFAIRFPLCQIL